MHILACPPRRHRRPLAAILVCGATLTLAAAPAGAAAPVRPVVKTGAAGAVTFQSASLAGTVNPGGLPTTYFFQYGPTTSYGGQTVPAGLAGATRALAVASPVAGLLPVHKYHYRLVGVNTLGTAVGADATFTTRAIPISVSIAALPNPVVFGSPAGLVGALAGTGAAGRPVVLQANPFPFTTPPGFQNVGDQHLPMANGAFSFTGIPLALTTQLRVVSVGGGAPVLSPVVTEYVALHVIMHTARHRLRGGSFSVRFSGTVSPAEPGARVSVQRLVGSQWRFVRGTNAGPAGSAGSSYSVTLRRRHGGFYRVFARPVEGGHVDGASQPVLLHLG
jgi:hypothetical protein